MTEAYHVEATCTGCGWEGNTSEIEGEFIPTGPMSAGDFVILSYPCPDCEGEGVEV